MKDTPPDEQAGNELSRADWRARLGDIGAAEGFYRELGNEHSALFIRRGGTLIVTFENLDHVYSMSADRMPWGHGFVEANGWSMLGLMAHDFTWYRDEAVFDFFDELAEGGFFSGFGRVVFYGASMGAYAAGAFSAAAPGSTVILISPQATLSREIAPWETRYVKARRRDFTRRYAYAPDCVAASKMTYLLYDPAAPLDAMHAALFSGPQLQRLRCRYFGHRLASLLMRMNALKPLVAGCVEGTLSEAEFYRLLRRRRETERYQREFLDRLINSGNRARIVQYCEAVLARRRAPKFRKAMKAALASD